MADEDNKGIDTLYVVGTDTDDPISDPIISLSGLKEFKTKLGTPLTGVSGTTSSTSKFMNGVTVDGDKLSFSWGTPSSSSGGITSVTATNNSVSVVSCFGDNSALFLVSPSDAIDLETLFQTAGSDGRPAKETGVSLSSNISTHDVWIFPAFGYVSTLGYISSIGWDNQGSKPVLCVNGEATAYTMSEIEKYFPYLSYTDFEFVKSITTKS